MQFYALFVLFALAFASEHELEEGPCPHPASVEAAPGLDWGGHWYAAGINCEFQVNSRHCLEVNVEFEGTTAKSQVHFKDAEGNEHLWHRKYEQVEGHPGRYAGFNKTDDGYVKNGWEYTVVAVHGDAVLEFGCKEIGDKHLSFHRAFARTIPISGETKEKMLESYAATGDTRPTHPYKHDGCEYKWA